MHCCAVTPPRCVISTRTVWVGVFDVNCFFFIDCSRILYPIYHQFNLGWFEYGSDSDSTDVRLPALRHFTCFTYSLTDLLTKSVELLTLKVDCITEFFNWPRLIDMEFKICPRLDNWGPGVSFPSLERLSVHQPLFFLKDEVKEICRRAPRLSALSLVVYRLRINCDGGFCQNVFENTWVGLKF